MYNNQTTCVTDPLTQQCGIMASVFVSKLLVATFQPRVTATYPSCTLQEITIAGSTAMSPSMNTTTTVPPSSTSMGCISIIYFSECKELELFLTLFRKIDLL